MPRYERAPKVALAANLRFDSFNRGTHNYIDIRARTKSLND